MLTEEQQKNIEVVLSQDHRPWARLSEALETEARGPVLLFKVGTADDIRAAADDFATAIEVAGFKATIEPADEMVVEKGEGIEAVALAVTIVQLMWPKLFPAIGKHLSRAGQRLLKALRRAVQSGAEAVFDEGFVMLAVREWLNENYGVEQWDYKAEVVRIKPIGATTLVKMTETTSGECLQFAVDKYEVTVLRRSKRTHAPRGPGESSKRAGRLRGPSSLRRTAGRRSGDGGGGHSLTPR
jgi:hypothetical protein